MSYYEGELGLGFIPPVVPGVPAMLPALGPTPPMGPLPVLPPGPGTFPDWSAMAQGFHSDPLKTQCEGHGGFYSRNCALPYQMVPQGAGPQGGPIPCMTYCTIGHRQSRYHEPGRYWDPPLNAISGFGQDAGTAEAAASIWKWSLVLAAVMAAAWFSGRGAER